MKINRAKAQVSARILDPNRIGIGVEPPRDAVTKKTQSFGDFVAAIYEACGERRAGSVVRLAVNGNVVVFQGRRRLVVS